MNKFKYAIIFIGSPVLITIYGCASITQGTSQTIAFNLEPPSTKCDLNRDGEGQIGSISFKNNTLSTGKDKDDIIAKCNAPGYKQQIVRVKSSTQAIGVVGGIVFDLGITDMLTGAMWKYPDEVTITLVAE